MGWSHIFKDALCWSVDTSLPLLLDPPLLSAGGAAGLEEAEPRGPDSQALDYVPHFPSIPLCFNAVLELLKE